MEIEPCAICGEPVDANEIDPCGHFGFADIPCTFCGEIPDEHYGADHEYESGI